MMIKIVSESRGEHVHQRVYVGPDADHLTLSGKLVMNVGEWQEFGAALLLAEKYMLGKLSVSLVGDREVVQS